MNRWGGTRRQAAGRALAAFAVLAGLACGKKGDPQAPLPRGPNAVSNLAVEQEGEDAVLTFGFPDRLLTGSPLTDLASIEIYRVLKPSSALLAPAKGGPGASAPTSATGPGVVSVPGSTERRAATNARLAEEAFYKEARLAASLPLAAVAEHTRGASVVYRDSLSPLWAGGRGPGPEPLAYAVVSVRRNGERSPLSNIASLTPAVPPQAAVIFAAIPEEGRICLEWSVPEKDVLGRPVELGGYEIYRRILPQEEYETPLNAKPVPGTTFVDTTAPYGSAVVYTVRATLAKNTRVEGLPAEEVGLLYRDVFPPPPPKRLDALSEGTLVRLLWDPVDAPDLAGYIVYRAEGTGEPVRLSTETISEPFATDESVKPGIRYRYTVRSIDRAGNESGPSPEAVAEPF